MSAINDFSSMKNQFSGEMQKLQSLCQGRSDVRQKDLSKLGEVVQKFVTIQPATTELESRTIKVDPQWKQSIEQAIRAVLFFQQMMPNRMDARLMGELFNRLFATLSARAKELEKQENKMTRLKRQLRSKVTKSEQSKKSG